MTATCDRCGRRYLDQLGLVWHLRAAHEGARADLEDRPMTAPREIPVDKRRLLELEIGPHPLAPALAIGCLLAALVALAGWVSL